MGRRFGKHNSVARKKATRKALQEKAEERFTELGLTPTFNKAPDGAEDDKKYAGLPIIDTMEILATVSEMAELDRLMSASSEAP